MEKEKGKISLLQGIFNSTNGNTNANGSNGTEIPSSEKEIDSTPFQMDSGVMETAIWSKFNLDDNEQDDRPAYDKAFQNPLIMDLILSSIDNFEDLLSLRLCYKGLASVISAHLLKHSLTHLNFSQGPDKTLELESKSKDQSNSKKKREKKRKVKKTLEDLFQIVQSPHQVSPVISSSFQLRMAKEVLTREFLSSFFLMYGHNIKTLNLELVLGNEEGPRVKWSREERLALKIILTSCPLEKLELQFSYTPEYWDKVAEEFGEADRFSLPLVKVLRSQEKRNCRALFQVIRWSPDGNGDGVPLLEEIQGFQAQYVDHVVSMGKIHCIKSYNFQTDSVTILDAIIRFAAAGPSLTFLKIREIYGAIYNFDESITPLKMVEALSAILNASSQTLRHLDTEAFGFLPFPNPWTMPISPLVNLKKLELRLHGTDMPPDDINHMFPPQTDMGKLFPALEQLVIWLATDETECWGCQFPEVDTRGRLLTVREVEIHGREDTLHEIFMHLGVLTPNVKILKMADAGISPFYLTFIWTHFKNLEELEFYPDVLVPKRDREDFDEAFTGLEREVCIELRKNYPGDGQNLNPPEHAISPPSITDLKRLKILRMKIQFPELRTKDTCSKHFEYEWPLVDRWDEFVENFSFISWVSGHYAFKMMKDLNVTIIYDHQHPQLIGKIASALASVKPFVNIVHGKD